MPPDPCDAAWFKLLNYPTSPVQTPGTGRPLYSGLNRLIRLKLYDEDNAGSWDTDFYAGLIGTTPLRVADVGCGTGTFAVRRARAGHTAAGVDPADGMLAVARERDGGQLVTWLPGTAVDLPAGPFDAAVMTGSTGPELQESTAGTLEVEEELLSARELPDGVLVTWEDRTRFLADGERFASRSTLKFTPTHVLVELLAQAGFSHVDWYGDWNGGPFVEATSREIIVAARTPAGSTGSAAGSNAARGAAPVKTDDGYGLSRYAGAASR